MTQRRVQARYRRSVDVAPVVGPESIGPLAVQAKDDRQRSTCKAGCRGMTKPDIAVASRHETRNGWRTRAQAVCD